jgi:hypothetical protein
MCCWYCALSGKRSLRRADHWSRGVLTSVVRRFVLSRKLKNEEAMARGGPQPHWAKGGGGERYHIC